MNSETPRANLNIKKPARFNRYRVAAVVLLLLGVVTVEAFWPDPLIRSAIKSVDPTFFDPPYENFDEIRFGMTVDEVHDLLGPTTPPDPTQFTLVCGCGCGGRGKVEAWYGTRGIIVVSYFDRHRAVAGRGVDEPENWIVYNKRLIQERN